LAMSRAFARRALRPLSRMTAQAELATSGTRGWPAHASHGADSESSSSLKALGEPSDPREVAALAVAFNRLIARLDGLLATERSFTQDAAHEMRTPLTVISGEIEFVLADEKLSARDRDALRRAYQQSHEMSALVDALLLLRRADALPDNADDDPVNLS